ncbi:MAG: hypothetical protein JNJ83_12670 [Verrucomicrobiaceae bacterium]|nr:hypothetical protein [Verrucomicrobiaceae bacterium]
MKNLVYLLPSLFVWLALSSPSYGELVTVTLQKSSGVTIAPITINVPAGKVFETVSFIHDQYAGCLSLGTIACAYSQKATDQTNLPATNERWRATIVGPVSLTLTVPEESFMPHGSGCILTYNLTDNVTNTGIVSPSNGSAVVIPTDATGPVQIILESSVDLVNWTAANPGTYAASAEKRFFRVRAVNQ